MCFRPAVDDALAATLWIEATATSMGVDVGRIAIGGDKALGYVGRHRHPVGEKEKGGIRPRLSASLMFPNTLIGGDTSSLNEFAVGIFWNAARSSISIRCICLRASTKIRPRFRAARQAILLACRRPM